jgi:thiol-disulfide isomerase/thioredoxin
LRGKVVIVDFWTYSCINSLRNLPYLQAWAKKYRDAGLVVIGAHTPEFGFEKDLPNIERAVREYGVTYPVAIDSDYAIWKAFDNEYWPADYFIDGKGRIRYHHFGEGDYLESERVIQHLLAENGATGAPGGAVRNSEAGVEAPPSNDVESPETYVGYRRAENFASPEQRAQDSARSYSLPARTLVKSVRVERRLGHWSGVRRAGFGAREDRISLSQPRFALGDGAGQARGPRSLSDYARRQSAG